MKSSVYIASVYKVRFILLFLHNVCKMNFS